MGGRGSSGGIRSSHSGGIINKDGSLSESTIKKLENNGFKRWKKDDKDRIYINSDTKTYFDVKTGFVGGEGLNDTEKRKLKEILGDKIEKSWTRRQDKIEDLNINFNKNVDNTTSTVKKVEIFGNQDGTIDIDVKTTYKRDTPVYDRFTKKYSDTYDKSRVGNNLKVETAKVILNNAMKTSVFSKAKNYNDLKKLSDKINKKFPGTFEVWKSE